MNPGIYIGVLPSGSIPKSCVHKVFSHYGENAGRQIAYYEVWIKEPDEVKPTFKDDNELQKDKVSLLDKIFNIKKKKILNKAQQEKKLAALFAFKQSLLTITVP